MLKFYNHQCFSQQSMFSMKSNVKDNVPGESLTLLSFLKKDFVNQPINDFFYTFRKTNSNVKDLKVSSMMMSEQVP